MHYTLTSRGLESKPKSICGGLLLANGGASLRIVVIIKFSKFACSAMGVNHSNVIDWQIFFIVKKIAF